MWRGACLEGLIWGEGRLAGVLPWRLGAAFALLFGKSSLTGTTIIEIWGYTMESGFWGGLLHGILSFSLSFCIISVRWALGRRTLAFGDDALACVHRWDGRMLIGGWKGMASGRFIHVRWLASYIHF